MDLTAIFSRVESIIEKSLGGKIDDYAACTSYDEQAIDARLFLGGESVTWSAKYKDIETKTDEELAASLMDLYSRLEDAE